MLLRGFGFALAIALGGLAIWLIATSDTVKAQRVGALAGMWGVLIGAYAIFGARRHEETSPDVAGALELRQDAALARSQDVAWQREFQARLEALLRREVQEGVSRELAGLRHEVASLRNEILEKVGGQLRMERTETTRLFGSNLEALQREVRLLKVAQLGDTGSISTIDVAAFESSPDSLGGQTVTVERTEVTRPAEPLRDVPPAAPPAAAPAPSTPSAAAPLEPEPPRGPWGDPEPRGAEESSGFPPFRPLQPVRAFSSPGSEPPAQAPTAPAAQDVPEPSVVRQFVDSAPLPPYVAPAPSTDSAPLPPYALPPQSAPAAAAEPAAQSPPPPSTPPPPSSPAANPPRSDDPFASMPRIRPFTDFELDSVDRATTPAPADKLSGRHSTVAPQAPSPGGRRRRAEDSENDVLAQILAREKPSGPQQ